MSETQRYSYLDALGGLLIIYMVFTHICQIYGLCSSLCYRLLQSILFFFMPWFFFKSGMLKNVSRGAKEEFIYAGKKLMIPYLKWSCVGMVVYVADLFVRGDGNPIHYILSPFKDLLMTGAVPGNLPLWFLFVLFLCRLVFSGIGDNRIYAISAVTLCGIAAFLVNIFNVNMPYWASSFCLGLLFYGLGYLLKNIVSLKKVWIFSVSLFLLSYLCPSVVDFRTNELIYGYYLIWVVRCVAAIISFNKLFSLFGHKLYFLSHIGRNSMIILTSHWPILVMAKLLTDIIF